ncbi:response regulator [Caulobacter sp. NIBR1757]|uniref:response regulator transcription factor n=1 Tax=Caulobacter sp. NIBR1757 TaxID=3016000 RepID=UPI0022F0ACA3|nr:response regulator [Caulobacter sp. NIBR1757]WGM37465.1 hypothetical protein AMEJIAPC_00363 [Caulobacter sp. NIBR1757]
MNLDLGILWIEDSFSQEEEENLKRRVREAGFLARIETIENGARVEELARVHRLYHQYDIILLDYKLKGEDGNDLAPRIRDLFPSTTILFYSGSADENELRRMIAEKQVEGVYCSARGRFIERAGSLIDQTARALDRLSGMRGLAMRVVAECDTLMRDALLAMSARDPACDSRVGDLDEDVINFVRELGAGYEVAMTGDLSARLDSRAVDSAKLFKHFRRLTKAVAANPAAFALTGDQVERLRELRASSAQYDASVLRKRNILGHVVEVQGPDGWILEGSNEISVSDFPELRRNFAAHIDAFREIGALVVSLDQ